MPQNMKRNNYLIVACLLVLVLVLSACSNDLEVEKTGGITGVVTVNGSPEPHVEVSIPKLNRDTETDDNGVYRFSKVPNGVYTLYFYKEGIIPNDTRTVVVNGDEENLDYELSSGSSSLQEAKQFSDELTNNNIQLSNTVGEHVDVVGNHIKTEVATYMKNLVQKTNLLNKVFGIWNGSEVDTEYVNGDSNMLEPGIYTYDANSTPRLYKNSSIPEGGSTLYWEINFVNITDYKESGRATIEMTNPEEVIIHSAESVTYDLREAVFNFDFRIYFGAEEYIDYNFDFILDSDTYQSFDVQMNQDESDETIPVTMIIPDSGQVEFMGSIFDNTNYIDNDDPAGPIEYEPLGIVNISMAMHFDTRPSSNNHITYIGSFECPVLSIDGTISLELSSFPDYTDLLFNEAYPEISKIELDGSLETQFITLNDGLVLEFDKIPEANNNILPSLISSYGSIELENTRMKE